MLLSYHDDDPAFVEAFRPGSIGTASFAHGIRVGNTQTSHLFAFSNSALSFAKTMDGISPQRPCTHCSVVHNKQCFTGMMPIFNEAGSPRCFETTC